MTFAFREDGYFNMTKAAAHFGKRTNDFLILPSTSDYLDALDKISNTGKSGKWIDSKKGRYGGTFAHPKLAVRFAQWLDVKFAVWCDAVIEDILTQQAELKIVDLPIITNE